MNFMKKIICLLLALCIVGALPVMAQNVYAEDTDLGSDAVLLEKLGIIKKNEFKSDGFVTKADFAVYAASLGADYNSGNTPQQIVDSIAYLAEFKGADLNGNVTVASAAKILVSVLGYEQFVLNKGYYTESYINEAQRLGILSGIKASMGDFVTYEDCVKLFSNAITVPYMKVTGYNSEGLATYEVTENTILNELHSVYDGKDVVSATSVTGLYSPTATAGYGTVKIGENTLKTNEDYIDFIGAYVKYYYKRNDDGRNVLVYAERIYDSVKINAEDIGAASLSEITYYENGKTKTAKIADDAAYIFNGVADPDMKAADLKPASGYILLSSSTGKSVYDTLCVWSFDTFTVYDHDYNNWVITERHGGKREYVATDYEVISVVDAAGNPKYLIDVKYGVTCSIAEDKTSKLMRIVISDTKISGTIKSMKSTENIINIDGTDYKLSQSFLNSGWAEVDLAKPGVTGDFYIDAFGEVADMSVSNDGMFIGYVINAALDDTPLNQKVVMRILTQSGDIQLLECADKVSINSQSAVSGTRIIDALRPTGEIRQLIRYAISGKDKKVTKIDTAYTENPEDGESEETLKLMAEGSGYLKSTQRLFSGKAPFDADTPIFKVPALDDTDATDEDYSVVTGGSLSGEITYNYMAYTIGDGIVSDYIVNISNEKSTDIAPKERDGAYAVVKEVYKGMDSNGDTVQYLECFYLGAFTTFAARLENTIPENINAGDTVFLLLKKNKVYAIQEIYDFDNNKYVWEGGQNPTSPGYYLNECRTTFGRALQLESNFLKIGLGADPENPQSTTASNYNGAYDMFLASAYKIVIVDATGKNVEVRAGGVNDLKTYEEYGKDCDTVVVYSSYANPRYMTVYQR